MRADVGPTLAFFTDHRYAVVFIAAAIDSTGLPFPGRLFLLIAGGLSAGGLDTTWMVLLAAAGALVGDHALYLLGWLGGDKVLSLYCRWTIGSARSRESSRFGCGSAGATARRRWRGLARHDVSRRQRLRRRP